MHHFAIDGNEANVKDRVGSNRYAFGIIWGLYHIKPDTICYTIYLREPPLPDLPPATSSWTYRVIPSRFAWTQWRLPLELLFNFSRPQVIYSPGHYAPRFSPIPTVVSIMDLAFLTMPNLFLKFKRGAAQLASWTHYSVKQAKAIIAISQHTKRDIIKHYQAQDQKITIAYPGIDQEEYRPASAQAITAVKRRYHITHPYILHVGTLQPRKNIKRLIAAFERLPDKYRQVQLVLAGQTGWLTEDINQAITNSPKKDRIIRTGYVPPDDIPPLMSAASCLALVGLYEGFGMPAAEALACGTIPVVSNTSSLPEVVGEAGITVDPHLVSSITHGLKSALDEPESKRQKRLAIGKAHIAQFDWRRSAKIVQEVLLKIANK
jgi:glycosyltransferase involved in cell wall biosynthesis